MRTRNVIGATVAAAALAWGPALARAAGSAPTTRPAASLSAAGAISPDAQRLVDQAASAYAGLKSLDLSGTLSMELQVQGAAPKNHAASFIGSFAAPNRFRHETRGDVLLGGTGHKLYAYQIADNAYTLDEAPKGRMGSADLPHDLGSLLASQDPSILLALSANPSKELLDDVTSAAKVDDTQAGGVACPTIRLTLADKTLVAMAFDPASHLLRRVTTNLLAPLQKRRADLTRATLTVDYTHVDAGHPRNDALFAWSPPPGATDAAAAASAQPLDSVAASALEGKTAPAFKLKTLDGKTVALSDLKGHVVILDFWATWCGPCRMSLPHLDKLYQAEKSKGLEAFALDQQESDADVRSFVKKTGLAVPVLMDADGRVGAQYGVEGIPQTVVIDKAGKVAKIFIGFGPELPEQLQKAVDAARAK